MVIAARAIPSRLTSPLFVDIETFGARTGNADNRKAIQNCIDSVQGEAWVYIPPRGDYFDFDGQIILKSDTVLYADPGYAGRLKATLSPLDSNTRLITNQNGAERIKVLNIYLDGSVQWH